MFYTIENRAIQLLDVLARIRSHTVAPQKSPVPHMNAAYAPTRPSKRETRCLSGGGRGSSRHQERRTSYAIADLPINVRDLAFGQRMGIGWGGFLYGRLATRGVAAGVRAKRRGPAGPNGWLHSADTRYRLIHRGEKPPEGKVCANITKTTSYHP